MANKWGYNKELGPDNWHLLFSAACGHRQSPIDIQETKLQVACTFHKKKIKFLYNRHDMRTLVNTGYTWYLEGENVSSEISGGPLLADYELLNIHAHWGNSNEGGSEHTFDGRHHAAELHMVHWNKSYPSIEVALTHPDGLCVVSTLLKLGKPHSELQKIIKKIPEIIHKGNKATLDEEVNPKEFLPKNLLYWTYMGSLTTPPCLECVVWIVFDNPIEVSADQLNAFRNLRCHAPEYFETDCTEMSCEDRMLKNCRPSFPLGDRVLIRAGGAENRVDKTEDK